MLPTEDDARKIGSIGVLLPSYECRLVDEDGKDVKSGSGLPGEIWLRRFSFIVHVSPCFLIS